VGTPAKSANMNFEANGSRPLPDKRKFVSPAIEQVIRETKNKLKDKELATIFKNCFPNTLDTTVTVSTTGNGKPDTFIITGDITAMWLRDSSAQVWPYLPYAAKDEALTTLFHGLIGRQARCILIDPYANAFMCDPKKVTDLEYTIKDDPLMKIPGVAERKWEIDSLCYPLRLAHGYWKETGCKAPFDDEWREAMHLVVKTFKEQQRKNGDGPYHYPYGSKNGTGAPTKKVGLIHSGFRPSDDACDLPFLIPSNLFAATSLRQLAAMGGSVGLDGVFCDECSALADEIDAAAAQYGKCQRNGTTVWAYEVDGFDGSDHVRFMDDANVPSLLGLPYLGICAMNDPLYRATRAAVWNDQNSSFFKGSFQVNGKDIEGIGSLAHTGQGYIWPMSLIMRALTSTDSHEIARSLAVLQATTAGTYFMHESFDKDDPGHFSRPWFAWANTLFGELVLDVVKRNPELVI